MISPRRALCTVHSPEYRLVTSELVLASVYPFLELSARPFHSLLAVTVKSLLQESKVVTVEAKSPSNRWNLQRDLTFALNAAIKLMLIELPSRFSS
jgi:hypothetical protein